LFNIRYLHALAKLATAEETEFLSQRGSVRNLIAIRKMLLQRKFEIATKRLGTHLFVKLPRPGDSEGDILDTNNTYILIQSKKAYF